MEVKSTASISGLPRELGAWLAALTLAIGACSSDTTGQGSEEYEFLPGVTGDYLGQSPPGTEFRRFAQGIVSPEMHHSVAVSPDGREIYWAERNGIKVTRRVGDAWTVPEFASFNYPNGNDFFDDAPVISPDNTRLYFNSRRPYGSNPDPGNWMFWYVQRTADGWSSPQPLPEVINDTGGDHWQVSVAGSGTVYFGVISQDGEIGIYFSRFVNGVHQPPEPLAVANSIGGGAFCPFVAPDESYIIFNKLHESGGWADGHYISFKDGGGAWLAPQRLPDFPEPESAFVSRDGLYLFNKSYWVSAEIIEELRPAG